MSYVQDDSQEECAVTIFKKPVIFAIAWSILGLAAGIVGTSLFTGWIYGYGENTRLIADLTTDVATLRKIRAGDTSGAEAELKVLVKGSLIGIENSNSRLTASQRSKLDQLRQEASVYLDPEPAQE